MSHGKLLIIGAGGHAKVVGDCAVTTGIWTECLFFDDRWPEVRHCGPWRVVGRCEELFARATAIDEAFVAVGNNEIRLRWSRRLQESGVPLGRIVHPAAWVSNHAVIDGGVVVVAGATVNIGARLGLGCIANTGCSIDHDCRLGDGVHVSPGARLAGGVKVGELGWIGMGSAIAEGIEIGKGAVVGAGSVVINDVPDEATVAGVPARPIRHVKGKE